ncbi:MAG: hypothetical protein MJZ59_03200, partial [Paludibacteraceae bacterium]|nr:hypothetical protein [Paludibacteraceae bacterium]
MQKFFSLVCAILLVVSVSAAPVAQKAQLVKKAPVAVEQMQKVQLEKAQVANFNQLSAAPALKVINQKAQAPAILGKKVVKANHAVAPKAAATPAKAPAAVAEDINVTAVDWFYDDEYQDVYLQSENDLYIIELQEPLEYGKTYAYEDMVSNWVGTLDGEGYIEVAATDATLTVTKDQDDLIHIAATMVLEGVTHVISYGEEPFVPSGVQIPLNGTELSGSYNSWYYMYLYTAKVGENEIQLAFDVTAEQETYTKDQFLAGYSYYASSDYSTYVEFVKAASDFTVTTTETTKTLTGSLYADNGDEYILNLVYEKPDAKEITLVADTLNFFTKMLSAGYYQMQGYTVDSTYAFSFYFISKSLSGSFTEEDMDAYSTWVDQKDGKKTVVSYQNLSAANIKASLVNDILYYTGTMTLATNDGQEAEVTLNLSCPYKQEWGEWADFAPFGFNTGKWNFSALDIPYTQRDITVQTRKDNTGLKQYKLAKWGDGMFADKGTGNVDLVISMDGKYNCTITPTITDMAQFAITDYTTFTSQTNVASTYDPETATFKLAAVYFNPNTFIYYAAGYETFVMDQPILERDTVDVAATNLSIQDLTAEYKEFIYVAENEDYSVELWAYTDTPYGTFNLANEKFDTYSNITSQEGIISAQDGEFTVIENQGAVSLTGWMIGADEKYYRFNLSKAAGVLDFDTDAPFDATFAYSDMSADLDEGVIGIYATNADGYTIGLELYADPTATTIPAGT